MGTFIANKIRVFRCVKDPANLPLDCVSLFHLKRYSSATDSRAWSLDPEDRKRYILELVAAEKKDKKNKSNEDDDDDDRTEEGSN